MDYKHLKVKLRNGFYMPLIGMGTFQVRGAHQIKQMLDYGFKAGYRLIDTAAVYGNEKEIGKAIKDLLPKYNLKRNDIFITSKLAPGCQGNKALEALKKSIENLDCQYLDLYLIHWPGAENIPANHQDNKLLRMKSWEILVKSQQIGLVRNVGVSNYTIHHLKELVDKDLYHPPCVNQIEWHPYCHPEDLKLFCKEHNIIIQAYSSFGGSNNIELLEHVHVVEIARKLAKTPAQVLLKWALQQGIGVIPKARSQEHIEENISLNFVISDKDMQNLNKFEFKKFAWDPKIVC